MKYKETKGISLITLILIIVVLIILLAIGIYFKNRKELVEMEEENNVVQEENNVEKEENVEIDKIFKETVMGTYKEDGTIDINETKEQIKKIGGDIISDNDENILVELEGNSYIVENNGNIENHADVSIDGENTNNQYQEKDLIYEDESKNAKLYLKEENGYLHVYIEDIEISSNNNIQILISNLQDSTSAKDYKYTIEKGALYKISENGTITGDTSLGKITKYRKKGYECRIPLSELNAESKNDIRSIKVVFMSNTWEYIRDYSKTLIEDTSNY